MSIGRRTANASGGVIFAMAMGLAARAADPPPLPSTAPPPTAERVLVIDQEGPTRPAFVQFMDGFRAPQLPADVLGVYVLLPANA